MTRRSLLPALALLATLALAWPVASARAGGNDAPAPRTSAQVEHFLDSLHPRTGQVSIATAKASLQLAPGYAFLDAQDAQRVIHDLWGNPPHPEVLGMLLPGTDPHVLLDHASWAVVVSYVADGYVSDADAAHIDYNDMLQKMQKATETGNPQRLKQGYPAMQLVGWAEPPHYDAGSHKLYWARDLKFREADGSDAGQSLNYDIRVLGRHGYLSLNAVAPMDALTKVRAKMPQVLAMTGFDAGERYADYDSKTDKLAAYGIAALVAGGIAAKAGLFAKLGLLLLAAKKFVVLGIAALGGLFNRMFKRKRS